MPAEMVNQARIERAIRKLDLLVRLLSAALLALSARALVDGLTVGVAVTWALVGILLTISMALAHRGRLLVLSPEPMPDDQDARPTAARSSSTL